jgi:hypothetical protein
MSVMAEVVATGNSPYEVKTPGKEDGVGGDVRPKMWGLIDKQLNYMYNSSSLAKVAIYHSSASRDFVVPGDGTGLFCSEGPPSSVVDSDPEVFFSLFFLFPFLLPPSCKFYVI